MDPVTISLVVSGTSAGVAGVAWLIKKLRKKPPAPPPPPHIQAQEERRREEEDRRNAERLRRKREEEERRAAREALARIQADNLADTIRRIAAQVTFTAKRVKTGRRKIDERAIGIEEVEVPFVADDVNVRPLRDLSEVARAIPAETALDDDLFYARAASGEMLVGVDVEVVTIKEPVYEDVWEERQRTLILVLDVSGSVFPQHNPWMPPVWKGLCLAMIDKAQAAEAIVELHEFDHGARGRLIGSTPDEYARLRARIANMPQGGDTNIGAAVLRAIERLEAGDFSQAEIMLITDGADRGGVSPVHVRERLNTSGIKLHVVLMGVQHQSLLACADTYQIVENTNEGPKVRNRVARA